jgi:hypothetical protein
VRVLAADRDSIVFEASFRLPGPVRDVREIVRLHRRALANDVALLSVHCRKRADGLEQLGSRYSTN